MTCSLDYIPTDKRNILWKIYDAFFEATGLEKEKIHLHLVKNVPIQAGLGGGSSNGAFFLKYLNNYYHRPLKFKDLIRISKKIGADIPFFLINKCALVEGIGEKITTIPNNLDCDVILVKPAFGVNTKEAYENLGKMHLQKDTAIDIIIDALKLGNIEMVRNLIKNDLEQGLLLTNEKIIDIKYLIDRLKNVNLFMSGSGSTYFALVKKEESEEILISLKETFPPTAFFIYKTKFI